ncbi:MAG: hypothetical protein IT328_20005 [Caldilineaceae bacterium]|nr:hypothetical protein [Caldilineaceae bacterium]
MSGLESSRITSEIVPWRGERPWRAVVKVDGYEVVKSYHDSHEDAVKWCEAEKAKLAQEGRR